jgi:hypothetical protein
VAGCQYAVSFRRYPVSQGGLRSPCLPALSRRGLVSGELTGTPAPRVSCADPRLAVRERPPRVKLGEAGLDWQEGRAGELWKTRGARGSFRC